MAEHRLVAEVATPVTQKDGLVGVGFKLIQDKPHARNLIGRAKSILRA